MARPLSGLKYLPRFRFELDSAADHAARIDELLKQVREKD
jgi:ribosome-binding factor A